MKKITKFSFLSLAFLLSSCSFGDVTFSNPGDMPGGSIGDTSLESADDPYKDSDSSTTEVSYSDVSIESIDASSVDDISEEDYGDFKITTSDGEYTSESGVFTISKAGTYNLSGTLSEGRIYINVGDDDEVKLNLKDVSITSTTNSPIWAINADKLTVSAKDGTKNVIIDNRSAKTEDSDDMGEGAISAKCDLQLSGQGKLDVKANYNNGVHTTKDLKIKNQTLSIYSYNNALKGKDSVTIESGTLLLVSTGGNGIITENTDISSKGNQRGIINITGGRIDIYSCKDAIDAAYDVVIENGTDEDTSEVTIPVINVYTSNFSEFSGEVASSEGTTYYLRTNYYNSAYRYSLYCKNSNNEYSFVDTEYKGNQTSGGGRGGSTTYYYFTYQLSSDITSFKVYKFATNKENSLEEYVACTSDFISVNSYYDTIKISDSGSNLASSGWTTYSTQSTGGGGPGGPGGGMSEGNTDKSEYSAKGIKSSNVVYIKGGIINLKTYDDGIHANYGDALENESTGVGDVCIEDGVITIYASDDGIHADRYLSIKGGTINITNAYEGLEANVINVYGGKTTVYATDDGLNASAKAGLTVVINVEGGIVDVTVASGDTDGIDSNGTYTQSGGFVISRGSGSNMSTGLDTDRGASISGGTFLCFGRPESTPSTSGNVKAQTISGTFGTGTYTFTAGSTSVSTTNSRSYSGVYIYSDLGTFSYTKA